MTDLPPPATPAVRPPWRWLRGVGIGAGVLLTVALVAHFLVLPAIVRAQAAKALDGLGLAGATFDVRRATPWGSTISNVANADGTVRVDSVEVSYAPLAVIRGRLKVITLRGADVRVAVRDGNLKLPIRPTTSTSTATTTAPTTPSSGNSGRDGSLPFAKLEVVSSAVTIELDGQPIRAAVDGTLENRASGQSASAKLGVDGGRLALAGVEADLGQLRVTADAAGDLRRSPSVRAEVVVQSSAVRHTASKLALADISLRVPVSFNEVSTTSQPSSPGSFEIGSVTLDGQKREPIKGTLAVRDGKADFSATWAALPGSMLTTSGWFTRDGEGELVANLPAFNLEDADAFAALVPGMEGWSVAGEIGADAKLSFKPGGRPTGRFSISANNATVVSKPASAEFDGVTTSVTVNLHDGAVSTLPGQRVTIARASFGKSEAVDSSITFTVERPDALLIEELSAGWLDGRISTKNVRINPSKAAFDATVVADKLSLKDLLALIAPGRAVGDGRMSGPVRVRFDGKDFELVGGYLRSTTPTGGLAVLDTKWLGETMDKSDPRFTADAELAETKRRILGALADFSYDRLNFSFAEEPEAGGRLTVNTHGKGRVGGRPQELDVTLNFRGVNDVLNEGLLWGQRWQRLTNPTIGQ